MSRRRLLAAAAPLLAAAGSAPADQPEPDAVLLSVEPALPPGGPLVQEMVLLTVRAIFRDQPNQVTLEPPAFTDARWQAMGDDDWGRISLGGPMRVLMQRRIAWFAQRSGALDVGPFTLDAMVLTPSGARVPVRRRSAPFRIGVLAAPAGAGTWWLPARSFAIREMWSVAPDRLAAGQVTRRTLVSEASGVEASQLPPLPPPEAPGIIAFALPVQTTTTLTANGPRVRVTHAWDLRPVSDAPALLPEIRIPWFDTQARTMREAVVPPRRVSLAGVATDAAAGAPRPDRGGRGALAAGLAAFLLGSAALHAPWRPGAALLRRLALAWEVRGAARRGDAAALRAALSRAPATAQVRAARDALDRHLYAASPSTLPALDGVLRAIVLRGGQSDSASPLPGPLPPGSAGPRPSTIAAATASPRQR